MAGAACPVILMSGSKHAECNGDHLSVCIHSDEKVAVTVYSKNNSLYYKVGKIDKDNMTIQWGDSVSYYRGRHPSIALIYHNGKFIIIEVHNGPYLSKICYCCVGIVNQRNSTIMWEECCPLQQKGLMPNVCAKDDQTVIIIYEKAYAINKIQYRTGKLCENLKKISWDETVQGYQSFHTGTQPAIAISEDNIVVVVYREGLLTLKILIGVMRQGRNISWGNDANYAEGKNPSVSINAQGVVVEAHQSGNLRKLFHRAGMADKQEKSITWNQSSGREYTLGRNPIISISKGYLLEAHRTNSYSWDESLFYSLGKLNKPDNPVNLQDNHDDNCDNNHEDNHEDNRKDDHENNHENNHEDNHEDNYDPVDPVHVQLNNLQGNDEIREEPV